MVNFFSLYFIPTNEEIHLPFKNSEKQWAQALRNIKITNYLNQESSFNGAFSINNFPRIKDGTYVINCDDKKGKGTHWVSLVIDRNTNI